MILAGIVFALLLAWFWAEGAPLPEVRVRPFVPRLW